MDKSARVRWALLLTALTATVAAIWMPVGEKSATAPSAPALRRPALQHAIPPEAEASARSDGGGLGADDPFAPRGWQPPPPPALVPVARAEPLTVAPVDLTPQAPVLPFRFVGSMNDSAEQVVYLAHGEQALVARTGEVIEGTYKVLGITQTQIEFEYIPTGVKQALTLPARDN